MQPTTRFPVGLLAVGLIFLGGACGSDGASSSTIQSCTITDVGNIPGTDSCTDYVGWPMTTVMQLCSIPNTQYAPSPCSTANRIGGCHGSLGSLQYTRWYFPRAGATPVATTADVMADCARLTPAETFIAP